PLRKLVISQGHLTVDEETGFRREARSCTERRSDTADRVDSGPSSDPDKGIHPKLSASSQMPCFTQRRGRGGEVGVDRTGQPRASPWRSEGCADPDLWLEFKRIPVGRQVRTPDVLDDNRHADRPYGSHRSHVHIPLVLVRVNEPYGRTHDEVVAKGLPNGRTDLIEDVVRTKDPRSFVLSARDGGGCRALQKAQAVITDSER